MRQSHGNRSWLDTLDWLLVGLLYSITSGSVECCLRMSECVTLCVTQCHIIYIVIYIQYIYIHRATCQLECPVYPIELYIEWTNWRARARSPPTKWALSIIIIMPNVTIIAWHHWITNYLSIWICLFAFFHSSVCFQTLTELYCFVLIAYLTTLFNIINTHTHTHTFTHWLYK